MPLLKDVAQYVRSKAAGPFWVTIDIFCGDDESFDLLRKTKGLDALSIADLYKLNSNEVRVFHDRPLKVIKISFPRPIAQGSARDADSHAGQYFVPLLDLTVA